MSANYLTHARSASTRILHALAEDPKAPDRTKTQMVETGLRSNLSDYYQ